MKKNETISEPQTNGTATSKSASDGLINANNNLKVYSTLYTINIDNSTAKSSPHKDVLRPGTEGVWVASRCTSAGDGMAWFAIRVLRNGTFECNWMFGSFYNFEGDTKRLFSVVTVPASLIKPDGANFKVER